MGSSRNREAGHKYERDIVNALKAQGFEHVVTTRSCNRARDAEKIDIANSNEAVQGRFPYNIQAKNKAQGSSFNYVRTLSELPKIPGVINVILRKLTAKSATGKFISKGTFAFLEQEDFLKMSGDIQQLKVLKEELNKHPEMVEILKKKDLWKD